MRSDFTPRDLETSQASGLAGSRTEMANTLYGEMRNTFVADQDVNISVSDAIVTVSAGRRAVQIQALEPGRFLVSFRRRHSFHMHPGAVPADRMAALVEGFMRER